MGGTWTVRENHGAKVNRNNSSGLLLCVWKRATFRGSWTFLDYDSGPGTHLKKNWLEVELNIGAANWLRVQFSEKGWAFSTYVFHNPKFSLTWWLIRNVLSLNIVAFRGGWADLHNYHLCDLDLEETSSQTFYDCPQVLSFWDYSGSFSARINVEQLVSIMCCPCSLRWRRWFVALLIVARMVVWTSLMEEIFPYERYCHKDLIG